MGRYNEWSMVTTYGDKEGCMADHYSYLFVSSSSSSLCACVHVCMYVYAYRNSL